MKEDKLFFAALIGALIISGVCGAGCCHLSQQSRESIKLEMGQPVNPGCVSLRWNKLN